MTMGRLVVEAAEQGAEIIVLPELATCGYSHMSEAAARPFSEPVEGLSYQVVHRLCVRHNVYVAYGFMEAGPNGDLHNAQALVGPHGLEATYRKMNPWGQDWIWAKPGTASPPIVKVRGKRVGLLICRDVRDKTDEVESLYEAGDTDLVCFSANFGAGAFPSGSWVKFAKDNKTHLIVSNRYGTEANNDFGSGGICVITPGGDVLCEGLRWAEPCIVYADV